MNNANIVGRLTKDPEPRTTQAGTVLSVCVAVDRGDKNRSTDFIDCVAFGKTADFITQYFHKGDAIMITGKLQTRIWEKDNGTKQKFTEIIINECGFVPRTGGAPQFDDGNGVQF